MSTLMLVDGQQGEPIDVAVTRRLREEFGRLGGLSISEVARRVGMTQQALSQRMSRNVDFKISELATICDVTGASYEYVTTGIRALPDLPTRQVGKRLPRLDSNQQPFGEWLPELEDAA